MKYACNYRRHLCLRVASRTIRLIHSYRARDVEAINKLNGDSDATRTRITARVWNATTETRESCARCGGGGRDLSPYAARISILYAM